MCIRDRIIIPKATVEIKGIMGFILSVNPSKGFTETFSINMPKIPVNKQPVPTAVSYTHLDVYKRQPLY